MEGRLHLATPPCAQACRESRHGAREMPPLVLRASGASSANTAAAQRAPDKERKGLGRDGISVDDFLERFQADTTALDLAEDRNGGLENLFQVCAAPERS